MSQEGVISFLRENKRKWFDTPTIKKELGMSSHAIVVNCSKLRKYGDVRFKSVINPNSGHLKYLYCYK